MGWKDQCSSPPANSAELKRNSRKKVTGIGPGMRRFMRSALQQISGRESGEASWQDRGRMCFFVGAKFPPKVGSPASNLFPLIDIRFANRGSTKFGSSARTRGEGGENIANYRERSRTSANYRERNANVG